LQYFTFCAKISIFSFFLRKLAYFRLSGIGLVEFVGKHLQLDSLNYYVVDVVCQVADVTLASFIAVRREIRFCTAQRDIYVMLPLFIMNR